MLTDDSGTLPASKRVEPQTTTLLSRRRRRFFQVSLRTLLVLLTVGCVWFGWMVNSAQKQRAAAAWVREMGGGVIYDCDYENRSPGVSTGRNPRAPFWLRDLIGVDLLSRVDTVDCEGVNGLSDISPLRDLAAIHSLWLIDTSVRDLRPLRLLTNIRNLGLANTEVSDLTPLSNLKALEFLGLEGTRVNDLSPLRDNKNLDTLQLAYTSVSDLTPLEDLKKLSYLDVSHTKVRDVRPLLKLKSLRHLYLRGCSIGEADVTAVKAAIPYVEFEMDRHN